jgi:hypothetical protein
MKMQSKHLDVSHVLMAADPLAPNWETALKLAASLAKYGVRTTLACISAPSVASRNKALRIADIDVRVAGDPNSLEWMLFLEMLAKPDLIQVFDPQHVLLPWRSPTVLHIPDSALLYPTRPLFEASSIANLIVVEDEARFDKLQAIVGAGPFVAVLRSDEDCGWTYFLAYQEIVQGIRLDLGDEGAGRFELI